MHESSSSASGNSLTTSIRTVKRVARMPSGSGHRRLSSLCSLLALVHANILAQFMSSKSNALAVTNPTLPLYIETLGQLCLVFAP